MTRLKKLSTVLIPLVIVVGMTALSQEIEREPLVAPIMQEISSHDVAVILENIFLYPNERSLYGPGKENYGMPVREEYGKGPVVVLNIKKKPDWFRKLSSGINPWLHVQLYSDGKPLSQDSSSSDGVFGFSFWVPGPDNHQSVELTKLGNVECEIRLSTIVKVCDIPLNDVSRGSQPFFEDDNVQVWDVKWQERSGYNNEPETSVKIGIETKTKFMTLDAVFKSKDGGQDIKPTSTSLIEASDSLEKATLYFSRYITKSSLNGAELWKIIPVVEKTFPVRFVPQESVFGQNTMAVADLDRETYQEQLYPQENTPCEEVSLEQLEVPEDFYIVHSRGPTHAEWGADRSVVVAADGSYSIKERSYSREEREQVTNVIAEGRISSDAVKRIYAHVIGCKFFELKKSYWNPNVNDGVRDLMSVSAQGKNHSVSTFYYRVQRFESIYVALTREVSGK